MIAGRCLCGAVRFEADAVAREPVACHCSQCRRQSGHVWASVPVPTAALRVAGEPRWFEASPDARRGFCPTCGSVLFWQAHGADEVSVSMGALDAPTGLRLGCHIFAASKGDYYDIADGLPQEAEERPAPSLP